MRTNTINTSYPHITLVQLSFDYQKKFALTSNFFFLHTFFLNLPHTPDVSWCIYCRCARSVFLFSWIRHAYIKNNDMERTDLGLLVICCEDSWWFSCTSWVANNSGYTYVVRNFLTCLVMGIHNAFLSYKLMRRFRGLVEKVLGAKFSTDDLQKQL